LALAIGTIADLASTTDPARRLLVRSAALFALAGLLHVVVWAIDGGPWAGPVTWRKPIVFGLSIAFTTISLAWVLGKLPARSRLASARVLVGALVLEYGLIAMQRWRGVASHFNDATAFDGAVFTAMGVLILVASVVIVVWTREAWRTPGLAPDTRAAVLGGLLLLDAGLVIGIALSALGGALGAALAHPVVDALVAGAKPAHAIALHGPQTIPILAGLLAPRIADARRRATWIVLAATGQLALVVAVIAAEVLR